MEPLRSHSRPALRRRQSHLPAWHFLPRSKKFLRVLEHSLHQHLKVQVRPGGSTGRADFGNFLATLHEIALFNQYPQGMGVPGNQIIAMVNFDHIAVRRMNFLRHHNAPSRRDNRRAWLGGEIKAGVQR